MKKHCKIYRIASISNLIIHCFLFIFVVIVSFCPFREGQNFYQLFNGYFFSLAGKLQPFLILSLILFSCLFSFLTIKKPLFSIAIFFTTIVFFTIVSAPYISDSLIFGLSSPWVGGDFPNYQIGFHLINYSSYIGYLDFLFIIYSFIVFFVRKRKTN